MAFAIPLERLYETDLVMAFEHPNPSHALHVIIIPKSDVPNVLAASPELLAALMEAAQILIQRFNPAAYRIVMNGGDYQDVPLLHMHVISDLLE